MNVRALALIAVAAVLAGCDATGPVDKTGGKHGGFHSDGDAGGEHRVQEFRGVAE